MSKKTHEKELARARAKREAERAAQRGTRNRFLAIAGVVVLAVAVVAVALASRGGDDEQVAIDDPAAVSEAPTDGAVESDPAATTPAEEPTDGATTDPATDPTEAGATSDPAVAAGDGAQPCENPGEGAPEPDTEVQYDEPPADDYASGTVTATVETTCGTIVMELYADEAPQTVSSFAFLADEDFYAGVPFHRVQDQFVIQGGDPTGSGSGGPGYQFGDELALAEETVAEEGVYPRGTVAMANAGRDTNGSQFFVVQAEGGYAFPPAYAVFGMVTEGMDVVDRIAQGPTGGPNGDLAVDPVRMIDVTIS